MYGSSPQSGLITPRYTMPSHLAQSLGDQTRLGRIPTARVMSSSPTVQGGRRGGRGSAPAGPVLTPLTAYQVTVATPANWPGWIAVAKDATRFALREWISHSWIRKEDTSINSSILEIKRGALKSSVDFGLTIYDALQGAGAPGEVANAFGNAVWGAWKEWFQNYSMTVPEAFPSFVLYAGSPTIDMPWSASLTSFLRRGWSPGESNLRNLFPILWGQGGATAQEAGGSEAIQDYVHWLGSSFDTWKMGARIGLMIGGGQVPSYNPPLIVAGPVVEGKAWSEGPAILGHDF